MENKIPNTAEVVILQLSKDELSKFIHDSVLSVFKQLKSQPESKGDQDPLLKIEEVCELLQVSKVTVHKWKKMGKIPFHRISNRIFFKKSEILESIKKIDLSKFKL